jgi:hypothetical protein
MYYQEVKKRTRTWHQVFIVLSACSDSFVSVQIYNEQKMAAMNDMGIYM